MSISQSVVGIVCSKNSRGNIFVTNNGSRQLNICRLLLDGSNDACGVASTTIDISSFDCSNVGPNTVTLTVTDVNGNSSTSIKVKENCNIKKLGKMKISQYEGRHETNSQGNEQVEVALPESVNACSHEHREKESITTLPGTSPIQVAGQCNLTRRASRPFWKVSKG